MAWRRTEAAALLDAFFTWADAAVTKLSAKSALAEAFRYTIKRPDNNIAENAMRTIALGRKNYLLAGSDRWRPRGIAGHHCPDG